MRIHAIMCSICLTATAFAQLNQAPSLIPQQSLTTYSFESVGGTLVTQRVPLSRLPSNWSDSQVIQLVRELPDISKDVDFNLVARNKAAAATRVVLHAHVRGHQILEREIIVNVRADGSIKAVRANIPSFTSIDQPQVDERQARAILTQHILNKAGPANLSISESGQAGWIMRGRHLFPVMEFEVLDPARLRHFTARIDGTTGQFLGFRERTHD